MNDISTRKDIELLVTAFYEKVIPDPLIGVFFTSVADFSFEHHIPIMISFWETILLEGGSYKGNPMIKHVQLHQLMPLKGIHFERWLTLWKETLQEHFDGPRATEAFTRASTIATLMLNKLAQFPKPNLN